MGCRIPAALRLTNGKDEMVVMVTDGGKVIRADDGKVLAESIGLRNDSAIMVIHDDVIVNSASMPMTATQLGMIDRDTISFKALWSIARSSQYQTCATDGDYVYITGGAGVNRASAGEHWVGQTTISMTDGLVTQSIPLFRKGGGTWCMNSISRDNVYIYAGSPFFSPAGNKQPMAMSVSERGASGDLLAVSAVQRSHSCPIMEGDRMYMRGYQGIFCIGYNDEGRTYEATHVAETLLDQVSEIRPKATPVTKAETLQNVGGYGLARRNTIVDRGQAPVEWYFAGPFSSADKPPLPEEVLDPDRWTGGMSAKGTDWELYSLAKAGLNVTPGHPIEGYNAHKWIVCESTYTLINRQRRRVVDLCRVVKPEPNTTCYLLAPLKNKEDGIVQYEQTAPGVRSWLNGVEIKSGDRIHLPCDDPGRGSSFALLLEVSFGNDAPSEFLVSPRFFTSDDPTAEEEKWLAFVNKHKARLQKAIDLAPDSPEAIRAKGVLAQAR